MYPRLPLDYIGITQEFKSTHKGVDLGWHDYQGEPVYAAITGKIIVKGYYPKDAGNMIILLSDLGDKCIITRYLHLKELPNHNVGDILEQGSILGYMGNTGRSTGTHLHFEYWICPNNYKYKFSDQSKYAKNPLEYCYLYPNQKVSDGSKDKVKKYEPTTPTLDYIEYKVKKNDTLSKIGKKYNIDWHTIYEINKDIIGENPNIIKIGIILKIPVTRITYTVVKGDTLYKISKMFNVSIDSIVKLNKITNINLIFPGQVIYIK